VVALSSNIKWDEVIDKKARGIDDYDLGEVQEVQDNVVITQKGTTEKGVRTNWLVVAVIPRVRLVKLVTELTLEVL
jgi:hypothetical protein